MYTDAWLPKGAIVLTASDATMGKLIRWGSRTWFEKPTKVNHALGVSRGGYVFKGPRAQIIESDWKVREGTLWQHHANDRIWVFKHTEITDSELNQIVVDVKKRIGKWYGAVQIPLQLIDHKIFFGKPVTRWLLRVSPLDICSRLWAEPYGKHGYHFGVKPFSATPDDIWDFCMKHPEKYELVFSKEI